MVANFKVLQNKDALQNQTVSVGGDYVPPAEGLAKLRLIGYVEVGKQRSVFKGVEGFKDQVKLIFEIHGKKWEPKDIDGKKVPQRITVTLNRSTSAKAGFYKLFLKMRDNNPDITHMAELLGEAFMGKIRHREYEVTNNGQKEKRIAAELTDAEKAWTITPPYVDVPVMEKDEDTGEMVPTGEYERRPQSVPAAMSPLRLFIWDHADKEQWDSLEIEGADADKQHLKLTVLKAKNFVGSTAEAAATVSEALRAAAQKGAGGSSAAEGDSGQTDGDDGETETKTSGKGAKTEKSVKKPDEESADTGSLGDID